MGKAKKVGIGLAIAFGIFAVIVVIAATSVSIRLDTNRSSIHQEQGEVISELQAQEQTFFTDSNASKLFENPDLFKGSKVSLSGRIFSLEAGQKDGIQMWQGGKSNLDRNALIYSQDVNFEDFIRDDCVMIGGINTGESNDPLRSVSAKSNSPVVAIMATLAEKMPCENLLYPAKKVIEVGKIQEVTGTKITLQKVVFADAHTRVYLSVENSDTSENIKFYENQAKAIQGNKQFDVIYSRDVKFPEIDVDIFPGVVEEGVILFEPLEPERDDIRFHFEVSRLLASHDLDFIVETGTT